MKICAIMLVRNEGDIIGVNLRYHLSLGIDEIVVIDNGSSDDTAQVASRLGRRVGLVSAPGRYLQSELTTEHARRSASRGFDWVLPIDADEFWFAPSCDFRRVLQRARAGVLMAQVINFVQRRDQLDRVPETLLTMTMRAPEPIGPVDQTQQKVESEEIGFVEMLYPPKCVSRASPAMTIRAGNHLVTGIDAEAAHTDELLCFHAPFRARSILDAKAEQGRRVQEAGWQPTDGWHVRRWAHMAAEPGALDREWAANSYEDSALNVGDRVHPLTTDTRLADAVRPFIREPDGGKGKAVLELLRSLRRR